MISPTAYTHRPVFNASPAVARILSISLSRAFGPCVDFLQVEVQAEALQQHDEWDATPLYYASYAGNKELVKYLLSAGANCEEKVSTASLCLQQG